MELIKHPVFFLKDEDDDSHDYYRSLIITLNETRVNDPDKEVIFTSVISSSPIY